MAYQKFCFFTPWLFSLLSPSNFKHTELYTITKSVLIKACGKLCHFAEVYYTLGKNVSRHSIGKSHYGLTDYFSTYDTSHLPPKKLFLETKYEGKSCLVIFLGLL